MSRRREWTASGGKPAALSNADFRCLAQVRVVDRNRRHWPPTQSLPSFLAQALQEPILQHMVLSATVWGWQRLPFYLAPFNRGQMFIFHHGTSPFGDIIVFSPRRRRAFLALSPASSIGPVSPVWLRGFSRAKSCPGAKASLAPAKQPWFRFFEAGEPAASQPASSIGRASPAWRRRPSSGKLWPEAKASPRPWF